MWNIRHSTYQLKYWLAVFWLVFLDLEVTGLYIGWLKENFFYLSEISSMVYKKVQTDYL